MEKDVILFVCHIINAETMRRYFAIRNTMPEGYDIFWAYDGTVEGEYKDIAFFEFDWGKLCQEYGKGMFTDGHFKNIIYALFEFAKINHYRNYWFIEFDAIMAGDDWYDILSFANKYPDVFISSKIRGFNEINYLMSSSLLKSDYCYRYESFNPIFRVTKDMINKLINTYKNYDGYYNFILPSVCIEGQNYIDLCKTKFSKPENFHYLPVIRNNKIKQDGMLYHPVKF